MARIGGDESIPGPGPGADAEAGTLRARGDIAALLRRSALAQLLSVIRNFVILPILGPAQLGTFRLLQQYSAYSQHLSLGALSTLNVKYSEWEAAGDTARCEAVHRLALRQSVLGTLLFAPIFAALAWSLQLSTPVFLLLCVTAGFPLLSDYIGISYNVRGSFRDVARIDVIVALAGLVLLVAGALMWGLAGSLIASFIPPIIRVALGWRFLRSHGVASSWAETLEHYRFGLNVWVGATVSNVAATMDLVLLGWLLEDGSPLLGYYAVGLMVTQVLAQNLSAVTLVQQRALRRLIGSAGGVDGAGIALETRRLLGTDAFVGICFAAATVLVAYVVFPVLLPSYTLALTGLGALLTSILLIKARVYTRVILQNANRPRLVTVAPLVQLAFMAAIYPVVVDDDGTILDFALLRLAAFLLSAMLEVVLAHAIMRRPREGAQLAAALVLGLIPSAIGFIAIPVAAGHGGWSAVGAVFAVAGSYAVYNRLFDGAARHGTGMLRQVVRRAIPWGSRARKVE